MTEHIVELLFFDTFAHDNTEEINLDLVQFPKPVYVTEVRIIPLGARVQADFPGGVRLGATNPSQFHIEFFVNDLGKPGASTFETLGGFEYDQNGIINLDCISEETVRKIPTDGLVLRGLYTTITLAVYGTLTNNITEQIIQPVVNPSLPTQPNTIADAQQIISSSSIEQEWSQEPTDPLEYTAQQTVPYQAYSQPPETYAQEFGEYYSDVPKDPRSYHHTPENEWDNKSRGSRDMVYQKPGNLDRERPRERDREKGYSRSESRDRDRAVVREYREISRERDREWSDRDHDRADYRSDRERNTENPWEETDRLHERERGRERRHDDSYRRERYREDREERKRPRTPPILSPKRPHTPQNDLKEPSPVTEIIQPEIDEIPEKPEERHASKSPVLPENITTLEESGERMDVEEFEPILSDEDILDDTEQYQDLDYDYTTYTNNADITKLFTPGVTELQKYPTPKQFTIRDNTIIDVEENLKTTIGITDDYLKSSITKYTIENFDRHNTEIKEEFIHLCEKLLENIIGTPQLLSDIAKMYRATQSMTLQSMNKEDLELTSQVSFIVTTISDWLKIALDYEMANVQDKPPYKIRHIKCGVRLAEWVCSSSDFIEYLSQTGFNIHKVLLDLYDREFMALSIKLMILKALDTYLLHKFGIEKFLLGDSESVVLENGYFDTLPLSESNGYKALVESVLKNPQVRLRFAINSILKKLNLYEMLHKTHSILIKLRNVSHDISAEEINLITKSLNQILNYCQGGPLTFSQPKRFLPVASQFEIIRGETRNVLVNYFKMFNVLQCFIVLLTYPSTMNLPPIKTPIFEIVSNLLETPEGLQYLSENAETMNVLLKCLLRPDEDIQYVPEYVEIKSHNLGLNIAYKIQTLYHIERLLDVARTSNFDYDASEVIDQLHAMYCLTFNHVGKSACSEVLGMADNIRCLLQFFDQVDSKSESYLTKLRNSPSVGYIIDLIYFTVTTVPNIPLLEKHSKNLLRVMSLVYDDSTANKINELMSYITPFESITTLTYDNITPYFEIIEKNIEQVIFSPGQLITALRILQHLGISKHSNKSPIISENPLVNYIELKYKHVILQLYSLDATTILTKLLQKFCTYFEQPGLHSAVFVSNQGSQIISVIHPAVLLLKQMLSYVIQCQNTKFKDLTNIPVLLETYNLLNSFPATSPSFYLAQECKVIVVDTLLVYTQPVSDEFNEKDSLNKTLWTQMCGEVIRYITSAPYTFVSGLLIFSELLPLPLPIQTQDDLGKEEIAWAINLRRLWSAHLHPHSSAIQDMIIKLCVSTQPQLLNLLRRISVQLSDLAANSALMVARGILDSVYEALVPKEGAKVSPCNGHLARLLNFLACLVTHSTIKCSVLHLIHTNSNVTSKTDEKYGNLILAFSQVLKNNVNTTSNVQAQECILSIIQSSCDTELSLMQLPSDSIPELTSHMYLAHALPIREHLLIYIEVMLDHLAAENSSFVTCLPIVRTLLLLTEHDYGFYHLRENMLRRHSLFFVLLNKLKTEFSKNNAEGLSTLNTLVEFLRICVTVEEPDGSNVLYLTRTMKLTLEEEMVLIGWNDGGGDDKPHPLVVIEELLKKEVEEDNTLETILEGLTIIMKLLRNPPADDVKREQYEEITLPQPESLLVQFSCRTIFSSSDACDERLTDRYWLATPTDEESELDSVTCDLLEICRQNLSQDYSIIKEVEKLCRISRTEILDCKEKRIDDQKVKMKKPFVTPMRARGFARTVQQRPDLFRSRPPNTSRPPSLHVDDFVALETCGAQPTGPTGYNKISREMLASTRIARGTRGRAFVTSERSVQYNRQMPWWGAGICRGPYQM